MTCGDFDHRCVHALGKLALDVRVLRHAGVPMTSPRADADKGCCTEYITFAWTGSMSPAKCFTKASCGSHAKPCRCRKAVRVRHERCRILASGVTGEQARRGWRVGSLLAVARGGLDRLAVLVDESVAGGVSSDRLARAVGADAASVGGAVGEGGA